MDAGSYDNVEFPIRKPGGSSSANSSSTLTTTSSSSSSSSVSAGGSGTWPGGNHTASSGRLQVHHASKVDTRQTAKLATVEESTTEVEDSKTHGTIIVQNSTSSVTSTTSTEDSVDAKASSDTLRSQTSPPPYISQSATMSRHQTSGEQFDRRDLTPSSQAVVDKAYSEQNKHHRFNQSLELQGLNLKDQVCDMCRKPGESVSYEQLLQGMLVDGERLLLTGNWLYFTNVEFFDAEGTKTVAQPLGNGRACLTSRALLLLCAEGTLNSTVQQAMSDKKLESNSYRLDVKKYEHIYYRSIPLTCVRSVELNVMTGTIAETKLTMREPLCCGLCTCFGFHRCNESWGNSRPRIVPLSRRTITLGVHMPPWGTQTVVVIHLLPEMSVVVARDLVASLQTHAPALSTISTL